MNPSWYDLLGVGRDASDAEVKAAWKAAIADLDPTDRRFGVYNRAGEVLLDPRKRAAYDAYGAGPGPEPVAATGAVRPGPPVGRWTVPGWLLAAVAGLTVLAVAACLWFRFERPDDSSVEDSTSAAQSAAERAIGPILSYNALHLDEDQQAAESYMTSAYRTEYDKLFAVIKQNAPATKTIVTADVIASGIVRSGVDRVDVLLFVDRPTTNKQHTEPQVYKDQVTVTMENVDGEWLVDDLVTTPVGQ